MKDWVEVKIKEVGKIVSGGTPKTAISEYWGNEISWITPADLSGYAKKYISKGRKSITKKGLEKSSAKLMPAGSILFSSRAPIGYTVIAINELCTNQGFKSIIPLEVLESEFAYYYLKSSKQLAEKHASGTTFKELSGKAFSELPFPLPPLPEQRAIVAKIEQYFSELDSGIVHLKTAQEQLKIYRQAVLKKAFEGELTREWREQQTDLPSADELLIQIKAEREAHYAQQMADWEGKVQAWEANGKEGKKPAKPRGRKELPKLEENEVYNLPKLPKAWMWNKLGDLCLKIQIGPFGSQLHRHEYTDNGIPIINPKHIRDQKIIPQVFITEEKALSLPNYILKTDDVILGRRGEMGRSSVILKHQNGWFCGTGSLYIRFSPLFNGKLYSWILAEKRIVNYLEKKGGGTTMTNLNSTILNNLPIQTIPFKEQNQIVQEVESRLSVCDKVEESITESLQKAEALRQSILKKAFEGKLLSEAELAACRQEPDWEPAEVLLERIRAEKK